jgi:hypothetical protein
LLLEIFNRWLKDVNSAQISIDEKVLRGSKRDYEVPLMVVAAFSHRLGIVLEQVVAEDQDKIKAALHILERMPIKGKILTIGLTQLAGREPYIWRVIGQNTPYMAVGMTQSGPNCVTPKRLTLAL